MELHPLLAANVEYIICSSLLKRLRGGLEAALEEDDPANAEFLLLGFQFYHLVLAFACQPHTQYPVYATDRPVDSLTDAIGGHFESGLQMLTVSLVEAVFEREEGDEKYMKREEDLPNFKIGILLYILKSLNLIFSAGAAHAQQMMDFGGAFLQALLFVFDFAK